MNSKLVYVGSGMFGLGALVGWAFTADHFENKAREREEVQEAVIQNLRTTLRNTRNKHYEDVINYSRALSEANAKIAAAHGEGVISSGAIDHVEDEPTFVADESSEEEAPEEDVETTRSNLQNIIDSYRGKQEPETDQFVEKAIRAQADRQPPFVISQKQYAGWDEEEEGMSFEKITLTYFPQHRILLDDEEEPLDDIANVVGWRNLTKFGGESGDPDVVYIRNQKLMSDFEVVRETEDDLPIHVKYGMGREEFRARRAAGVIKLRPEDLD